MPTFQCTKCHKRTRTNYDLYVTGDRKRNVERAPECCGKPMIEVLED